MISAADAFSEDNIVATESALGALGKVIYFQRDNNIVNDNVVNAFLSKLPLKNEEEEAQKSHMLLFEQVLNNNANIVNENCKANLMAALARIKEATATSEITIVSEQGMQLLNKLV